MNRVMLVAGCFSILIIASAEVAAEEFVSRDEFQAFKVEFQKFKEQNEALKAANEKLQAQVTNFQTIRSTTPIETTLDKLSLAQENHISAELADVKSGTTKFLLTGAAVVSYESHEGDVSSFSTEFDPIFIWKLSDKLSFEAEVPLTVDGNTTGVELEYADIAYSASDWLTLQAGKFKSPFGLYNMRFDPAWINKFSDAPLVYDDGASGLVPHQELGVMASGAVEAGPGKLKYNVYVSNGMRVETADPGFFGLLINNDADNNRAKGVGGRLGYIPLPCLEFGVSGEFTRNVFDQGSNGDVPAHLLGVDFSFIHDFKWLQGTVDFKAEWIWSSVGNATYAIAGNPVAFNNNKRDGGYVQMAYRPTLINQAWVKNLELAVRYDRLNNPNPSADTPPDAEFQRADHDRFSIGVNYWLDASTVLKADYERDSHDGRTFSLQYAVGF